ncbi:hypothetical protein ACH3O9_01005 [Leeuwenhoekiella sp. A16]|uniref:hypothetical protein n=1 Tax=Leeuwenhoekiella sp. A16 TaxID=3141462 RepID=UPI003A7F9591
MFRILYSIYFLKFPVEVVDKYYDKITCKLLILILPLYFKLTRKSLSLNERRDNKNIIISLTTFPKRIHKVWLTIESIIRQTSRPDKIILWLYKDEFRGKESLPTRLLNLEKFGLEIRFCDENLKPHKKYYYTLIEFPNSDVITIDDDIIYPNNLIEKYLINNAKYPKAILCFIGRKINISKRQFIEPYESWNYLKNNTVPSYNILPIGVGSIYYPANSLHEEVLNIEKIKSFALNADDLWLKIMSIKNQTKVVNLGREYTRFFIPILNKNDQKLMDSNISEGKNDLIFHKLTNIYNISLKQFVD